MTQILDALPPDFPSKILCGYFNQTRQVQIVRIVNIPNWYFERVVFPRQHLLFEACSEAQLEIYTGAMSQGILLDTIGCDRLCIQQKFIRVSNKDLKKLPVFHQSRYYSAGL
ncbi:MAG: DUF1830 domain-containing protein [Coleofasciculus sp. G3-WIS-01]|uniref:DUF1830 domain-containing protein n=1 Tax=Coleofasciculus sp. G3-WIS-01 TaxID=3069528 RepID=UPI0032F80E3C